MEPRGAATSGMENKLCVVNAQPREMDASFPIGTEQRASGQRSLSGENGAGLCVQKICPGSWFSTRPELSGKTQNIPKNL